LLSIIIVLPSDVIGLSSIIIVLLSFAIY